MLNSDGGLKPFAPSASRLAWFFSMGSFGLNVPTLRRKRARNPTCATGGGSKETGSDGGEVRAKSTCEVDHFAPPWHNWQLAAVKSCRPLAICRPRSLFGSVPFNGDCGERTFVAIHCVSASQPPIPFTVNCLRPQLGGLKAARTGCGAVGGFA